MRLGPDVAPIVVAVDGSPASATALAWAHHHASREGRRLRVVTAFAHPHAPSDTAGAYLEHYGAAEHAAWERAARVIASTAGVGRPEHIVAAGSAEDVLITHSRDAAMIVLGTRATTDWRARFRGSLTNRLTGRVDCPVVSVPADMAVPMASDVSTDELAATAS